MDQQQIKSKLLEDQCDWFSIKMNVPAASHMGGIWERQIRSVRAILAVLLQDNGSQLDEESPQTLMCEAEAIVNSRPLTTDQMGDPDSRTPLTPNHLLTMNRRSCCHHQECSSQKTYIAVNDGVVSNILPTSFGISDNSSSTNNSSSSTSKYFKQGSSHDKNSGIKQSESSSSPLPYKNGMFVPLYTDLGIVEYGHVCLTQEKKVFTLIDSRDR
ncbi:hypothetical protein AC249_AIPGENE19843 [Exaiptasia diaphana]|nr:hypothetical protein AC249_AIPGENE19843 [Exaiptasia diaphana]